jgi:DNA-binding CsgD family transcriptional regulator
MPAADYRSLMRLIDQLYAGALDPAEWPKFLASVAGMFDAQNAFVCQLRDRREPLQYIGLSQRNRDALPVARFYATLIDEDPRAQRFSTGLGRPVHCGMGLTHETLRGSRAYREYLKPLDIEYTMVVVFPAEDMVAHGHDPMRGDAGDGVTHDLGLTRGSSGKAFDAADCDLLSEISPHIRRAFAIQRALEQRNARPAPPPAAQAPLPPESVLEQRLGLSPTQARTTALLMAGRSVKEIAEAFGIADNSVRQYLKRIYQRTGTQRQADLVRVAIRACDESNSKG